MKPWDEVWDADGQDVLTGSDGDCEWSSRIRHVSWGDGSCEARARLAAQAPAMARLLLFRMGDRHCEYCGAKVDRVAETGIQDPVYAGETLSLSKAGSHLASCVLVATLKAAGVVE